MTWRDRADSSSSSAALVRGGSCARETRRPSARCQQGRRPIHGARLWIRFLDRKVAELLQELGVAFTGVQILFAFLLSLASPQRFEEVGGFDLSVYTVALLSSAMATMVLIAPVSFPPHRFPSEKKAALVVVADRFARHEAESLGCRSRPVITSG